MTSIKLECYAVKIYAGSSEEYWSFLTPEATAALNHYHNGRRRSGEILTSDSHIFTNVHYCHNVDCMAGNCQERKAKDCICQPNNCRHWPIRDENVRLIVCNLLKKAGIKRIKHGARFNRSTLHQFRKRFSTVLKMAGAQHDLIEVMLGHKNGIRGVYFKPERDELFQEFKKFAADLTADSAERHRFEIEEKQKKIDILESGRVEVEDMSRAMDNMIKRIGFLEKARRVSDDEITEEDRMILNMYKKKVKEKISA